MGLAVSMVPSSKGQIEAKRQNQNLFLEVYHVPSHLLAALSQGNGVFPKGNWFAMVYKPMAQMALFSSLLPKFVAKLTLL